MLATATVAVTDDATSADVDTVLILMNVIGLSHVVGERITGAPRRMMDVVTPIVLVDMKPAASKSVTLTDDVTAFWV